MSWYELITTRGRRLQDIQVSFVRGEFKVCWARLGPDEDAAVLIDRASNCEPPQQANTGLAGGPGAYINKPFGECQLLAAIHGYELTLFLEDGESFLEHIEWFLGSL